MKDVRNKGAQYGRSYLSPLIAKAHQTSSVASWLVSLAPLRVLGWLNAYHKNQGGGDDSNRLGLELPGGA